MFFSAGQWDTASSSCTYNWRW